MKVYWTLRDVEELERLSPQERRRIWKECFWRFGYRHWQCWLALVLIAVCFGVGSPVLALWLMFLLNTPLWSVALLILIGAFFAGFVFAQVTVHQLRPHLRDYVQGHHV